MEHIEKTQPSSSSHEFSLRKFSVLIAYVVFFAVLNETVFNVSIPKIAEQFQLQASQVSWVMTTFIITFGLGQVIFGKLTDLYDLRKLIVIGILIYTFSSLIGFAVQSVYPLVIICRIFQGAGASALPALTMVIVARYFNQEQRGKLFGLFTSTASLAVGIGPVIGGYVSAYLHWSFLFLIPVFVAAAIPAFLRLLPKEEPKDRKGKVDLLGAFLLAVAITSLILFTTVLKWPYLVISILVSVWFIAHIRRTDQPFVEPQLFANRLFRTGIVIGFIVFGAVVGIMFLVPLMLSKIHGISTDEIGTVMFPGAISAVIFGTIAGNVTAKKGCVFSFYLGAVPIFASLLLLASLAESSVWLIGATLVLMYIGLSFVQTAMAETVTQTLPMEQIGVGMGLYGLAAFISGAVGTAGVASLLDSSLLDFRILPTNSQVESFKYSNLLLFFAFLVALSAIWYFTVLGKKGRSEHTILPEPTPIEEG